MVDGDINKALSLVDDHFVFIQNDEKRFGGLIAIKRKMVHVCDNVVCVSVISDERIGMQDVEQLFGLLPRLGRANDFDMTGVGRQNAGKAFLKQPAANQKNLSAHAFIIVIFFVPVVALPDRVSYPLGPKKTTDVSPNGLRQTVIPRCQAVALGPGGGLSATAQPQFVQNMSQMRFDCMG